MYTFAYIHTYMYPLGSDSIFISFKIKLHVKNPKFCTHKNLITSYVHSVIRVKYCLVPLNFWILDSCHVTRKETRQQKAQFHFHLNFPIQLPMSLVNLTSHTLLLTPEKKSIIIIFVNTFRTTL